MLSWVREYAKCFISYILPIYWENHNNVVHGNVVQSSNLKVQNYKYIIPHPK